MGNREALLAGAKRSLLEKGYDRTTVRDITAAAGGVSMAAIGYHFGSREALLNAALIEALEDWGATALAPAFAKSEDGVTSEDGYRQAWTDMIATFTEQPALWLASIEAFLQAQRSPELLAQLAGGQQEARRGLAAWVIGTDEEAVTDEVARSVGSVQTALISGLMMQWLTDPDRAPSSDDIVRGLRELVAGLGDREIP
jgi:AcrR family transcriptional regulator